MLEQIAYGSPRVQETKQIIYRVGDLEELSASALYYGTGGSPLGSLGSFGIVRTPLMKENSEESIKVTGNQNSLKIMSSEVSTPLVRLDYKQHENKPPIHLQYGRDTYTGRSGNEAADIFAELLRLGVKIKFPGDEK